MKKWFLLLLVLSCTQLAFARDYPNAANIKIRIATPAKDNRYFLCLSTVGCLSIKAANRGKVFPVLRSFDMSTIYVTNLGNMKVYNQGLPKSCAVTVEPNQTITISGSLVAANGGAAAIKNLRCSVG